YQKGKEKITGINYEPWHIRYVGKENAEYMNKNNLVLEEYVDQLKKVGK
ncbi:D-alanyl-D-alanine carboxypeptidase family protein, partial [Vagococcus sp.]